MYDGNVNGKRKHDKIEDSIQDIEESSDNIDDDSINEYLLDDSVNDKNPSDGESSNSFESSTDEKNEDEKIKKCIKDDTIDFLMGEIDTTPTKKPRLALYLDNVFCSPEKKEMGKENDNQKDNSHNKTSIGNKYKPILFTPENSKELEKHNIHLEKNDEIPKYENCTTIYTFRF